MTVQQPIGQQPIGQQPVGQQPVVQQPVVQQPMAPQPMAPQPAASQTVLTRSTSVARPGPAGGEFARRIIVFLFGIAQGLIVLRIVLLLLNAREANGIVSFILNASQVFVGPFEGILNTNALHANGSVLDIAAIVALIGWTIVEFLAVAAVGIFRREAA
jgi:YGGT family